MSKTKSEFKRVKRDGDEKSRLVKQVEGGGEVERNSPTDFSAYDAAGNYLGFFGDQATAEKAAATGRIGVATIDDASELSIWTAWNDALDSGSRVMVDEEGKQIIGFSGHLYVRAHDDKHGWVVELLSDAEMSDEYWDEAEGTFALRVLNEGKFRLE